MNITENTPEDDFKKEAKGIFDAFREAIENNDSDQKTTAVLGFVQLINKAETKPHPFLEAVKEAHYCEAIFEWAAAEGAFKVAIELARQEPGNLCNCFGYLSRFYDFIGSRELAWEAARAATTLARQFPNPGPLVGKLGVEIRFHLEAKELDLARGKVTEALSLLREECLPSKPAPPS